MSKRDDESQPNEMEVGMTTAERRRRRRRGAGLRVPSDNVPRSRNSTSPPPPVPEDPALAMSIAYSFRNDDASGPIPRPIGEDGSAPIAPEAAPTVIDPPSGPIEQADFEMKTREMTAVDLEALGLQEQTASSTLRMERMSMPQLEVSRPASVEVEVDVTLDTDPPEVVTQPVAPVAPQREKKSSQPPPIRRMQTVALSEEDLEEVRAATHPSPVQTTASPPAGVPKLTLPDPPANKTMPLQALDIEVLDKRPESEEPMSVPDIDIQELAERAGDSGEIPIDVDDKKPALAVAKPVRAQTAPPAPPAGVHDRQERKSGAIAAPADSHVAPPPPPPAAHKAPPAPPPAQKKPVAAAVAAVITKEPSRPARTKPWFVDLFDEDYLRTLPFLTPQATQAEAEFVIDTMSLAPGSQVLDLGCGYGRHAMELAARGIHVVGLDLSTPLLVRGGEEAHRRGLEINFVRGDMRELDFENQFDAAYCLFSTFGYFDDETNKKTLQNVARALKQGGKVLIEILNRDYVIADLPTRVWWEGDGCVVLEEVELNYFSSRIQVNRSVVFDDGRQLEQEISVRAYSLHEVGKLMHAAGFRVLEVSGGYQTRGRFFGNQSRHIIVLAERKETPST
ncbi:MAG: methyltransferase domain-containing protein [Acidobacteriota bacterium]